MQLGNSFSEFFLLSKKVFLISNLFYKQKNSGKELPSCEYWEKVSSSKLITPLFLVHTAQDTFIAYAFHCEPSSGPLCKTVEAACTLRYQKCLDARPQRLQSPSPLDSSSKKNVGDQPSRMQSHTTIKKALKTIFFGSSSTS